MRRGLIMVFRDFDPPGSEMTVWLLGFWSEIHALQPDRALTAAWLDSFSSFRLRKRTATCWLAQMRKGLCAKARCVSASRNDASFSSFIIFPIPLLGIMSRYASRYYDHAGVTSEDGKSLRRLTCNLTDKSVDYEEEGQNTYHYGSDDDCDDDDLSQPRRHSSAPSRRHPFVPPTPAQETQPEVAQMKGHGKKRKLMEKGEGAILP